MGIWDSRCIDEGTREFVETFMSEAEHGVAFADALAESFVTHLSYVPEEQIGWEISVAVEDPADEVFVSRRVADLMLLGDGWFDEMMGAVEDALAVLPRTA